MGHVKNVAKSTDFIVKNWHDFKDGLQGYVGGDGESPLNYSYFNTKRRSKNGTIHIHESHDFSEFLYKQGNYDDCLNLLEYIQEHMLEGEECIIHHVSYEHPMDMCIYKYTINKHSILEETILDD